MHIWANSVNNDDSKLDMGSFDEGGDGEHNSLCLVAISDTSEMQGHFLFPTEPLNSVYFSEIQHNQTAPL